MKTFQYCLTSMATVVGVILLGAAPATAQEHEMEVGNKDEVMFTTERMVGNLTFAPGHYRVQHRMEGTDHFVQFTFLKGVHQSPSMGGNPTGTEIVGQIKCRVEPLDQKASRTLIYSRKEGGGERITKILVRGENVAHVL